MKNLILLFSVLFVFGSCKKQNNEEYYPLSYDEKASTTFLSYEQGDTFKLMSNSNDTFKCEMIQKSIQKYKTHHNSNTNIYSEIIKMEFLVNEQSGSFTFYKEYYTDQEYGDQWYFNLYINLPQIGKFDLCGEVLYQNGSLYDLYYYFYSSIILNNKTYSNVYKYTSVQDNGTKVEFYTSLEDGIIYIKNGVKTYSKID